MTNVISIPSAGVIRPKADFQGASIVFTAHLAFAMTTPSSFGGLYKLTTTLVMNSVASVNLNGVEEPILIFNGSREILLREHQTTNPVVSIDEKPEMAVDKLINDGLGDDDPIVSPPAVTNALAGKIFSFGKNVYFEDAVLNNLGKNAGVIRESLVKRAFQIEKFYEYSKMHEQLSKAPVEIGDPSSPSNEEKAMRLTELAQIIERRGPENEARRAAFSDFVSSFSMQMKEDGFKLVRETKEKPLPQAVAFRPDDATMIIGEFLEANTAYFGNGHMKTVDSFVSNEFAKMVEAVDA